MTREEAMRQHPAGKGRTQWSEDVLEWLAEDEQALELANHNPAEPGRVPSLLDDLWFGAKVACSIAAAALVLVVFILYALTGVTA